MEYVLISACLLGQPCRYDGESKVCGAALKLLKQEECCLIPVCPEQMGGLATPRDPAERQENRVVTCAGRDVTEHYRLGAENTLALARLYGCSRAVLKEKSPSCGCGRIYDGTFQRRLIQGDGVTAALLKANGIRVIGESALEKGETNGEQSDERAGF